MTMNFFDREEINKLIGDAEKSQVLSNETVCELIDEYRAGNEKAREKIIRSNVGLVLSRASIYFNVIKSHTEGDLYQVGMLGLVKAIDDYDKTMGNSFSTVATTYIDMELKRVVYGCDDFVRIPFNYKVLKKEFENYINECLDKEISIPSDEELCKKFNVNQLTLRYLKEYNFSMISYDEILNPENDEDIPYDNASDEYPFDLALEDKEIYNLLLVLLKNNLNSIGYYVFYSIYLDNPLKTINDLKKELLISHQGVGYHLNKIRELVKKYAKHDSKVYQLAIKEVKKKYGRKIDDIRVTPVKPKEICLFLYLKDSLNILEKSYLYLYLFSKVNYTTKEWADCYEIDVDSFKKFEKYVGDMVYKTLNSGEFKEYYAETMESYGYKIFSLDLGMNEDKYVKKLIF